MLSINYKHSYKRITNKRTEARNTSLRLQAAPTLRHLCCNQENQTGQAGSNIHILLLPAVQSLVKLFILVQQPRMKTKAPTPIIVAELASKIISFLGNGCINRLKNLKMLQLQFRGQTLEDYDMHQPQRSVFHS